MDRVLYVFSVFVIIGQSAGVFANAVLPIVVAGQSNACVSAALQNETGPCCWCQNLTVKCILDENFNLRKALDSMLKLNYTHMEKMVYLLNDTRPGRFPLMENYTINLCLLEHFTELYGFTVQPLKRR